MYDEYTIVAHPFRAVTIGGVKLKVLTGDAERARELITLVNEGYLDDRNGIYELDEAYRAAQERSRELLNLKDAIRRDPTLLSDHTTRDRVAGLAEDADAFLEVESLRQKQRDLKFSFSWKRFLHELLDFDGNIFSYFHPRPVEYYLEEELIDVHRIAEPSESGVYCPICHSDNVFRGNAVDHGWSILQVLSILMGIAMLMEGFFVSRTNYHCFDCGHNFRRP
jgi:hypothetical protein